MTASYLDQFSEDEGYLDFVRVGPPSRAAVQAGVTALSRSSSAGAGTVDDLMGAEPRALAAAARLLGAPLSHVAYTPSTSSGLFQVAFALRGDNPRVLLSSAEFHANLYPWWRAAEAGRLDITLLPRAAVTPERVREALLGAHATALVVSAVDFATGYRADLPGLRDVVGDRLLIVDGIQALGAVDQDWTAADVLVAGGQKWLRSGWGTGVIAVSDRALQRLDPLLAGWTAVQDPCTYDGTQHPLASGAGRFSTTNASPVAQAALAAGLALLEDAGPAWVAGRIEVGVDELLEVLDRRGVVVTSERKPDRRAGIVAFRIPGLDGAAVHDRLSRAGIACTRHGERIRLSVHATTTAAALQRVGEALDDLPE